MKKFLMILGVNLLLVFSVLFPLNAVKAETINYCIKCTNYGQVVSDVTIKIDYPSEKTLIQLQGDLLNNSSEFYQYVSKIAADCENGKDSVSSIADSINITEGNCDSSGTATGSHTYVTLDNPINASSIPDLVGLVIKAVLGIVGALALLMFVWGGFTWVNSGGNSEKVSQGTKTMVWATIGIVVAFSAYIVVNYAIKSITS